MMHPVSCGSGLPSQGSSTTKRSQRGRRTSQQSQLSTALLINRKLFTSFRVCKWQLDLMIQTDSSSRSHYRCSVSVQSSQDVSGTTIGTQGVSLWAMAFDIRHAKFWSTANEAPSMSAIAKMRRYASVQSARKVVVSLTDALFAGYTSPFNV